MIISISASFSVWSGYRRRSTFVFVAAICLFGVAQKGLADPFRQPSKETEMIGWQLSRPDAARISDDRTPTGQEPLEVSASKEGAHVWRTERSLGSRIVFIDFQIRPAVDHTDEPRAGLDLNGSVLGFVRDGDRGAVFAVDLADKTVPTGVTQSLSKDGGTGEWMHFTVRQDVSARTWDLFIDGKLVLIDQALPANAGLDQDVALLVYADVHRSTFIGDVTVSDKNSLFEDSDGDGIPDAYEQANGMNPHQDDRLGQALGNGRSNLENFRDLTLGESRSSSTDFRSIIYVENTSGSDQNTGELSYTAEARGPLRSLSVAMRRAKANTVIAILPGDGAYDFEVTSEAPDTVTLLPLGDVTIQ